MFSQLFVCPWGRGVAFHAYITGNMRRGFGQTSLDLPIGGGSASGHLTRYMGYYGIPSTSVPYASYWNAFLFPKNTRIWIAFLWSVNAVMLMITDLHICEFCKKQIISEFTEIPLVNTFSSILASEVQFNGFIAEWSDPSRERRQVVAHSYRRRGWCPRCYCLQRYQRNRENGRFQKTLLHCGMDQELFMSVPYLVLSRGRKHCHKQEKPSETESLKKS